jgi:hypothetical protein
MPDFGAWSPASWAALAAWVTVLVAVAAGTVALQQVREARKLREEQSQPYVVAYIEPSRATEHLIDLVIRNFGSTAAYDITVDIEPRPQRTARNAKVEEVQLFSRLPVLVPGQEWRTLWDNGPDRAEANLPDHHTAIVRYSDSRKRQLPPLRSELDWTPYRQRRWVVVYGQHDAAQALRDIKQIFSRWQDNIHGELAVVVRDGDVRDKRQREQFEELERERDDEGDQD